MLIVMTGEARVQLYSVSSKFQLTISKEIQLKFEVSPECTEQPFISGNHFLFVDRCKGLLYSKMLTGEIISAIQ
jgi:hypothetical protein